MITIDDRIIKDNEDLFTNMIGKTFKYYKHDPLVNSNSVYKIVGIYIDNDIYALTNSIKERDYYGAPDDVSVFKINNAKDQDIHSFISNRDSLSL